VTQKREIYVVGIINPMSPLTDCRTTYVDFCKTENQSQCENSYTPNNTGIGYFYCNWIDNVKACVDDLNRFI
jgi:hypothetical protein